MRPYLKWLAQIGAICSSLLAILCPLCIPALGALLASIGLGFALRAEVLHSGLVALLVLSLGFLAWSARLHERWGLVAVGLVGAALVYSGRYIWYSLPLMGLGAALLIGASFKNLAKKSACTRCSK